ncbi:MAG: hypothetical protein NTV94_08865 [Planctomycetota bacterium]|nr:hypothetical protein [Planctomycetota bacterium]
MSDTDTHNPMLAEPFEASAREVSIRLRDSLVEALTTVGADATRPQSIVAQLGINKILAWRLARIAGEDDAAAALARLPGNSAMRIVTDALEKAGSPAAAVDAVRAAIDSLEQLIQTHAGDRETLGMMLSGLTRDGQQEREEATRKLAFTGNSGIWGISARVQFSASFVALDENPAMLNMARLGGYLDLRRLRAQVPWPIATAYTSNDAGSSHGVPRWEPIDPSMNDASMPPLMTRFCSHPLPTIHVRTSADGCTRYDLAPGPIGNTALVTAITGRVIRGIASRYRTESDTLGEHLLHLTTPVEVVYHDLFIHQALASEFIPTFHLYSQMGDTAAYPMDGRAAGLLPVCDDVVELGGNPPALSTPDIPRYREMAEAAANALGHRINEFRGYRVRMRYPPVRTVAILRHGLAEPPR